MALILLDGKIIFGISKPHNLEKNMKQKFLVWIAFLYCPFSLFALNDLTGCSWLNRNFIESSCGMGDRKESEGGGSLFSYDQNNQSTQRLCVGEMYCSKEWKADGFDFADGKIRPVVNAQKPGVYKLFCPARQERINGRLEATCTAVSVEKCFESSETTAKRPSLQHDTRLREEEGRGNIKSDTPTHK